MPLRDALALAAVVLIWGTNLIVAKAGMAVLPPLLLTALRFAVVAAVLVPLFGLPRYNLKGVGAFALVMGVLHFGGIFVALSGLGAAATGIVSQLGVPFAVLLGILLFHERLGPGRGAGLGLAFSGVVLLAGTPAVFPDLGYLAIGIGAMVAWAAGNIIIKHIPGTNPFALNGWMGLVAAPATLLLSLALENGHAAALTDAGWRGWLAVGYSALGASITAHSLWYWLVGRHPMVRIAPFALLPPVIAVAGGVLVLGEPLTWQKVLGGILTLAGVRIIQVVDARARRAHQVEEAS